MRTNAALVAFNRGLISPKALARVDLDRVKLSAEVFNNFLAATQGSMSIRPGTKWKGSSLRDTGAYWVEFVAATDDVALLELTANTMRVWLGDDAHELELLSRQAVDTTVSLSDTGWSNASTGGNAGVAFATNLIPTMTGSTTNGVEMTASSASAEGSGDAWRAGDGNNGTQWDANAGLPAWLNVDFGAGNAKAVGSYTLRAFNNSGSLDNQPQAWRLIGSNFDTGTFATDTGKWTLEDERSGQTGWSVSEKRTYAITDTGTPGPWRHWRLHIVTLNGDVDARLAEFELLSDTGSTTASQAAFSSGVLTLNASSIGARAKTTKRVIVSDTGTEHALAITVERGPVVLRVGSTSGDDDYIAETNLGAGYHNLAFTPQGNFWITLQSDAIVDRVVSSLEISDSGTVEVTTPWGADELDDIRHDQSADVVFADCPGVRPQMIERRGSGRSFSVVDYAPDDGPFLSARSSSAKLSVSHFFGNTTLTSDIPFFTSNHVGALIRAFHDGQSGQWRLGAAGAYTDPIEVTGISDTGTPGENAERQIVFSVSGTWTGRITIERSVDGKDIGFKPVPAGFATVVGSSDTGTFTKTFNDPDDNLKVWYRARIADTGSTVDTGVGAGGYTSGVAVVRATYGGGGVTGIARITSYNSNTSVGVEVLSRFSDTGPSDNWQQGYWSDARGYPTAVALHGGRLFHAQGGSVFGSVSDDYQSFDESTIGDAGPVIRTLGSGPVDNIHALLSLLRLIIHTSGAELTLRSSSLDEPVTPTNSSAGTFSTQGTARIRALKMDNRAVFVQRSRQRLFMVGPDAQTAVGDYGSSELTALVPDLLAAGIVSIAIQRQPDTRFHCALADGTVAILTYEPAEEVICWTTWTTEGAVERVMVLPGVSEDAVYYHIRRTLNRGNDSYTKILLHFDGTDGSTTITDDNAGGSAHTWTVSGNAQIDTAQSKFGGESLLLDGTGDYISTPAHADFALGAGDWTVDCWFNCNAAGGTDRRICGQTDAGLTAADSSFWIRRTTGNVIEAQVSDGSSVSSLVGTTQFTDALNTGWHHLALVRHGNTLMLFIDGVQDASAAFTGTVPTSSASLAVGVRGGAANLSPWLGWIDEFRLSVGVARWTSAFTVPTSAYSKSHYRFLEKWALESECQGDTGLHWVMDCAASYTDTGRTLTLTDIAPHLAGENVIVWGSLDTGSTPHVDLSPDTGSDFSQRLWAVDTGGDITLTGLTDGVHHATAGLPYSADWRSSKLAYGAQAGTALAQMKRVAQLALILYNSHARSLYFGSDTGALDPMPRVIDGEVVDQDHIFGTLDNVAVPAPGTHQTDPRVHLRARAPRPVTVLAAIPSVATNERV